MATFCTLKIILIGESGVGKTSLLRKFLDGIFVETNIRPITFIEKKVQKVRVCGKLVTLEIWDTGGQETFRAMCRKFYNDSDGIILMYDVTNLKTYDKVKSWLSEVRKVSDGAVIIVGNKNENPLSRKVQSSVVRSYAEEEGLEFIETSVKSGHNVEKVFQILVRKILEQKDPTLRESSTATDTMHPELTSSSTEVTASHDTNGIIKLSDTTPKDTYQSSWRCLI